MVIRRISPMSCAKVAGILYAGMGLLFGGLFSLIALTAGSFLPNRSSASPIAALFGTAAVILVPIVYGVIGAIVAAISAFLYNIAAKIVGGLEIDIETAPTSS